MRFVRIKGQLFHLTPTVVHRNGMLMVYDKSQTQINISHGSSAFPPWHRLYLRILEMCLQEFGSFKLGVPYWNWSDDHKLGAGGYASPLWTDEYLGPDGDFYTNAVPSGPFCGLNTDKCKGKWNIRLDLDGPVLLREIGYQYPRVPSPTDVQVIIASTAYDIFNSNIRTSSPLISSFASTSFRPAIEGLSTVGHNSVHMFVGGSMVMKTSPNDPVFFLHHSFTDLIWLQWQKMNGCWRECYEASADKRLGQRWSDTLWPWAVTIGDVSAEGNSEHGYTYSVPKALKIR
jgi:tyrosinase